MQKWYVTIGPFPDQDAAVAFETELDKPKPRSKPEPKPIRVFSKLKCIDKPSQKCGCCGLAVAIHHKPALKLHLRTISYHLEKNKIRL